MKYQAFLILSILFFTTMVRAQDKAAELSKEVANPLADIISIPFQNNLNGNYGPFNRNLNVLNIQPVYPFLEGKLITRTIIPIVRIPDFTQEQGVSSSGLADIVLTAFYSIEGKGPMMGIGPVLEIPTGGAERGSQKWSAGPSFLILVDPGDWTLGALINNTWSFAGNDSREKVNHMLINLFIVKQLGDGWYVNSAPIITADWTAPDGDKWIVPLGAGGGKLMYLGGKLPVNLQTQMYYNVVRPDFGPAWQWRFQLQIILPKSILSGKKN
jgi:hypothetical protein